VPAEQPGLDSMQGLMEWMQGVIVDPRPDDRVEDGESSRAAQWVKPTDNLTSYERVHIYRCQYLIRMRDALKLDYPALARYLKDNRFLALVTAYVQSHPSRHYSLYRLGDNFPEFIARCREQPQRAFCSELARLERAVSQVVKARTGVPLVALPPTESWTFTRLVPMPEMQLLTFFYPVNDYFQSTVDNTPPLNLRPRDSWIAVFRMGFEVARLDMRRHEYRALSALVEGNSLHDTITLATTGPDALDAEEIMACFTRWCSLGLFFEARPLASGSAAAVSDGGDPSADPPRQET